MGAGTEGPSLGRLLVVEDEEHLAHGLKLNLELEGYRVDLARSARETAERLLHPQAYGVIILDVMLPDVDGFSFCRRLRDSGNYIPVIMLTARSSAEDRVAGLEAGADDYLVKPFELDELLARVQSLLRRQQWERGGEGIPKDHHVLRLGDRVQVDFARREALVDGARVHLTQLEFELLHYFAERPGRVIGRAELLEKVWKLRSAGSRRTVDNFISRLRRHFERDPAVPEYFVSVRGAGYKFVQETDTPQAL